MKLFTQPLTYLLIILLTGLRTAAQDSSSIKQAVSTSGFPKDSSAWESYLRRNVDTMAPVKNGAKRGIYTVVVRFITSKDGSPSDVVALTSFGYGMEEAVMLVVKKSPTWTPAQQYSKPVFAYHTVSFTFVVPKKKGLFGRRRKFK